MFWNISYDKWHGIIAAVGMVIIFAMLWFSTLYTHWSIGTGLFASLGKIRTAILYMIVALIIGHWLQCWNESVQARDPGLIDKYKTWENFVDNSKTDFSWFWRGTSVALVVNVVIVMLTLPRQ